MNNSLDSSARGVLKLRSGAFGLSAVGIFLIAFNLIAFILVQRFNPRFEKGDFKMFYTAALALRTGHASDLYSRDLHVRLQRDIVPTLPLQDVKVYTHPPYELLAFLPFSFLPYEGACYGWLILTLVVSVICGRLLSGYWIVLGLFPFLVTMLEQQDSALALLLLIGCWFALKKNNDAEAGLWLGLAFFKFPIVIPLAVLLLFWRPSLLKGLALSAVMVFLLSLVLVGPIGLRSYLNYVSRMAHQSAAAVSKQYQIDPRTSPTLRGLTYEIVSGGNETANPLLPVLLGALDLFGIAVGWKFMRSGAPETWKFTFALLLALLLSFHLLMHDLLLLALPFSLLQGSRARWPLAFFYFTPLVYLFYPHAQAWLSLFLIAAVVMMWRIQSICAPKLPYAVHQSR